MAMARNRGATYGVHGKGEVHVQKDSAYTCTPCSGKGLSPSMIGSWVPLCIPPLPVTRRIQQHSTPGIPGWDTVVLGPYICPNSIPGTSRAATGSAATPQPPAICTTAITNHLGPGGSRHYVRPQQAPHPGTPSSAYLEGGVY